MEVLLNGVLRLKLLNIPLASCSFINLDFLQPHILHFDNNILPSLVFETFVFMLSVFFYPLDNKITLFYT